MGCAYCSKVVISDRLVDLKHLQFELKVKAKTKTATLLGEEEDSSLLQFELNGKSQDKDPTEWGDVYQ